MTTRSSELTRYTATGKFAACLLLTMLVAGCSSSDSDDNSAAAPTQDDTPTENETPPQNETPSETEQPTQGQPDPRVVLQGTDLNNIGSPLLSLNPDGPGGSPNQSLRSGDVLQGGPADNVMIGGLGVDVLLGGDGDDVMIGGTEDFNANVDGDGNGSDNRDRAFGGGGNDLFMWAPGDGSDFYDGGPGLDVVAFGLVGEERDSDGSTSGAPFFNVNPPGTDGSLNFDGISLDPTTLLPTMGVSTSPGFCTVLDETTNAAELTTLALDHLVRFSLRGVANAFDEGSRTDDDGLRVALSLRNVEYVVCTKREVVAEGGVANIEVLDIRTYPPTVASLSDLPAFVQQIIR
ncbi:MAG: hypothetical protein AB8B97_11515 [Granulosicoccus sp.]